MTGQTFIIGIDGLGGSGKSTYAKELQRELTGAHLFHLDDFIHPRTVRYQPEFEEWYCYYHLQWRYEYLIEKLLKPLRNTGNVNKMIELYDKERDVYKEQPIQIPKGSTVIVEGVFLQRPELRAYFDQVIFIDADRKTRMQRVLERDTYIGGREEITDKYRRRYFPAEEKYMEKCKPLLLADEIIENGRGRDITCKRA